MNLKTRIETFGPSLLVALLGLFFLAQLALAAAPNSTQFGVIVPPWQQGGIQLAAAFNAPIVDLRWDGHLIILDISNDPTAIDRLKGSGLTLISTDITAGCDPKTIKEAQNET